MSRLEINTPVAYQPAEGTYVSYEQRNGYERARDLERELPGYTEVISEYVSERLGHGDEDAQILQEALLARNRGVKVYRTTLRHPNEQMEYGGHFNVLSRTIIINAVQEAPEEDSVQHENIHSILVAGYHMPTALSADAKPAMNGLDVTDFNFKVGRDDPMRLTQSGAWLNEALIEHVRRDAFKVPVTGGGTYIAGVAMLRSMVAMTPGLEKALLDAAVITGSRAEAWGIIENTFGLLWPEVVAASVDLLHSGKSKEKIEGKTPVTKILDAMPVELRDEFKQRTYQNMSDLLDPPTLIN